MSYIKYKKERAYINGVITSTTRTSKKRFDKVVYDSCEQDTPLGYAVYRFSEKIGDNPDGTPIYIYDSPIMEADKGLTFTIEQRYWPHLAEMSISGEITTPRVTVNALFDSDIDFSTDIADTMDLSNITTSELIFDWKYLGTTYKCTIDNLILPHFEGAKTLGGIKNIISLETLDFRGSNLSRVNDCVGFLDGCDDLTLVQFGTINDVIYNYMTAKGINFTYEEVIPYRDVRWPVYWHGLYVTFDTLEAEKEYTFELDPNKYNRTSFNGTVELIGCTSYDLSYKVNSGRTKAYYYKNGPQYFTRDDQWHMLENLSSGYTEIKVDTVNVWDTDITITLRLHPRV